MKDEKQLEREYRSIKQQAAPDLWNRIEGNLKEHPEREAAGEHPEICRREPASGRRGSFRPAYGMAAAAAAIAVLVTAVPVMRSRMAEAGPETLVMGAGMAEAEEPVDSVPEMAGTIQAGTREDKAERMAYRPLQVPEDAVTVAEDARYFSEGILADTDLLCGARVILAELCREEGDASGQVSRVVYQMEVDGIYYAEDYICSMDRITVESPIIQTQGDTAFVLYQLVPGETYLLPLAEKEEHYELLYPFAPQIQMVQGQGYLFHSGYASLVNDETAVARKEPEGDNDFYYDRMLLRNDDNFLSDLISLIEREK